MAARDGSSRLMELFLGELDERLRAFDSDLMTLEAQTPADEREAVIHRLFRGAHSLKGAASTVGATSIELVCHQLEDFLAALRDGLVTLGPTHADVLLKTTDALRDAGRLLAGGATTVPGTSALIDHLAKLARDDDAGSAPVAPPPEPPAPPPAPVADAKPPDETPPVPPAAQAPRRGGTMRVAAARIDALLRQSGELIVARHRIEALDAGVTEAAGIVHQIRTGRTHPDALRDLERSLERLAGAARADRALLEVLTTELDNGLHAIRMVPFSTACEGLDRIVRDSAKTAGKSVLLEIAGGDVGLDRAVIDRIRDPLVHLVRNAIDHGIELPAERTATGKSAHGTVRVSAAMRGAHIEIVVADDGRGIDREALLGRARERGITVPEGGDVATLVFLPGISTAAEVTGLSGRGVGLDAVRTAVEAMRGDVDIDAPSGAGTRFRLSLPLTLTTMRVVLFTLGAQVYALNSAWVKRFIRVDPVHVVRHGGRPSLTIDERTVPLVRFAEVAGERYDSTELPGTAILIDARGVRLALAVDTLVEERDVVVRPLGPRLNRLRLIAGASLLADGSIALVLRGSAVAEDALANAKRSGGSAAGGAESPALKRVLLVDDSVTTRALERSILEAAGFDVVTAGDGAAAWHLLESETVDVVVSDVDMPEMNGFALVEAIRASQRLRDLPVILVTGRDNEADRAHGLESGADAYITKSGFRQEALIEAIGELV